MAKSRTASAKKKTGSKKSAVPPPPPPTLLGLHTMEDLQCGVMQHKGAAVVLVVTPLSGHTMESLIPTMEKLNESRPAPLTASTNLCVCYATEATTEVCQAVGVTALPLVQAYSYGEKIAEFAGDNAEKMLLLAKMAAKAATEKEAALLIERANQVEVTN